MGVLSEAATLIGIKEDVINIEGSSDQGLVVSDSGSLSDLVVGVSALKSSDGPQALINGAKIKVDLHLVVLKSDQGKSKTGVAAVPELKGNVKSGLRKSIARSAHLTGSVGIARTIDVSELRVGDEGKSGSVTDHLEVSLLLVGSHGKLVPDVHPVTVLTVDALATNLHLNLGDKLLTREIQPTSIHAGSGSSTHGLVNLGHSHLKVGAVSKITVAADRAGHTAAEISLTVESLLDGLNSKVSVSAVCNLPKSDLRIACKIDVLCAVSDRCIKPPPMIILFLKKKNRIQTLIISI